MRLVSYVLLLAVPILGASPAATVPARAADTVEAPSGEAVGDPIDALLTALAGRPTPTVAAGVRARLGLLWGRSDSDAADLLAARAARLVEVGEGRVALGLLDTAVVLAPTWPEVRRRRAMLRLSRGEPEAAQADLEAALRAEPRHFPSMSLLAAALEIRGDRTGALLWLKRAAALDPTDEVVAERLKTLTLEVRGRDI